LHKGVEVEGGRRGYKYPQRKCGRCTQPPPRAPGVKWSGHPDSPEIRHCKTRRTGHPGVKPRAPRPGRTKRQVSGDPGHLDLGHRAPGPRAPGGETLGTRTQPNQNENLLVTPGTRTWDPGHPDPGHPGVRPRAPGPGRIRSKNQNNHNFFKRTPNSMKSSLLER
jgi:hypothetical protein